MTCIEVLASAKIMRIEAKKQAKHELKYYVFDVNSSTAAIFYTYGLTKKDNMVYILLSTLLLHVEGSVLFPAPRLPPV